MSLDVSFGTVWEAVAERLPDEVAISVPGRDYTYAEFEERSARLASALADAGVGPDDKVACYLYNGAAYMETVFAAFKLGAVPVNANYRYTAGELSSLLDDGDAAALVFSAELGANILHAREHVKTLRTLIRVGSVPDGDAVQEIPELEDVLASNKPRQRARRPGTDHLFMYTGGTTGKPKGVIWRLSDLLHSLTVPIFKPVGSPELPDSLDAAVELAVRARSTGIAPTIMPAVPLMHATGLFQSMGALLVGGRVVMARSGRLDARDVWETVTAQRVSAMVVAGNAVCQPLVEELLAVEREGRAYDLTALRSIISSGTGFSDQYKRALHERANVTIIDAIASSEGGPFAFAITSSVDDLPARFFPVPATRVLANDDREVTPGGDEMGVLAYSGPMPVGYYKDEARSAQTFRVVDGVRYAIPGDLAQIEADGAIRFWGRGSGVINTGGEKVHPHEVEQALLEHPDVSDVAVVGVPDEKWGERVGAVIATSNQELSEAELREWLRASLAGYKVPRAIVKVPALARTPTGKLEVAWARQVVSEGQSPQPGRDVVAVDVDSQTVDSGDGDRAAKDA